MLEQEILNVISTIAPPHRGVYPREVLRRLPPKYAYCQRTIERTMKRLADGGRLVKVGQRQGYTVQRMGVN